MFERILIWLHQNIWCDHTDLTILAERVRDQYGNVVFGGITQCRNCGRSWRGETDV